MRRRQRPVDEVGAAAVTTMLWTAKRAGSARRRDGGQVLQHVVDVVAAVADAAHAQHRRVDLERDRSPARGAAARRTRASAWMRLASSSGAASAARAGERQRRSIVSSSVHGLKVTRPSVRRPAELRATPPARPARRRSAARRTRPRSRAATTTSTPSSDAQPGVGRAESGRGGLACGRFCGMLRVAAAERARRERRARQRPQPTISRMLHISSATRRMCRFGIGLLHAFVVDALRRRLQLGERRFREQAGDRLQHQAVGDQPGFELADSFGGVFHRRRGA